MLKCLQTGNGLWVVAAMQMPVTDMLPLCRKGFCSCSRLNKRACLYGSSGRQSMLGWDCSGWPAAGL